jgi:hypothetical protein
MMRLRASLLSALVATALATPVSADSVFGIRGLGLLGRPLSARVFSSGGAFALFDGTSALNPAALGQLGGAAGWMSIVGTSRRFTDGPLSASLGSTRFPLFGFATTAGRRAVVGVSIGEYLDRTWAIATTQDTLLRDTAVTFTDNASSTGGVSDVQVGGAYRLTGAITAGLGVHFLVGSSQLSIHRAFSLTGFSAYSEISTTEFSGLGLSAGLTARIGPRLAAAGTIRLNGSLKASSSSGASARIALPVEVSGAVLFAPTQTVGLAATVGYQSWSGSAADLAAAGQPGTRSVWNVSVGAELTMVRWRGNLVPVRLGYRWRQLPFPVVSGGTIAPLGESAVSAGLGMGLAAGRATLDVGVELGSRSAGTARERFTTGFVGLTVRP